MLILMGSPDVLQEGSCNERLLNGNMIRERSQSSAQGICAVRRQVPQAEAASSPGQSGRAPLPVGAIASTFAAGRPRLRAALQKLPQRLLRAVDVPAR